MKIRKDSWHETCFYENSKIWGSYFRRALSKDINMLSYFDLRKGVQFVLEGEPYEVLEFQQMKKAKSVVVAQTKIRSLITGKVFEKNFHQRETFTEAEIDKVEIKFIYEHKGRFCFSEIQNSSKRFELTEEQIGPGAKFLKPNQSLTGIKFQDKIINVILPVKVQLRIIEAPPGVKGSRAQAGTKTVILETKAKINVPLFIEEEDIIEVNTQTGEYIRRIE